MQVHRVATKHVHTARTSDQIEQIAERMKWEDIGFLPVVDAAEVVVGVITDRDIVTRIVGEFRNPKEFHAEQIMSQPVFWVYSDTELEDACRVMIEKAVHRLVVCDRRHHPVGVLSLDDIAMITHGERTVARVLERMVEASREVGIAD